MYDMSSTVPDWPRQVGERLCFGWSRPWFCRLPALRGKLKDIGDGCSRRGGLEKADMSDAKEGVIWLRVRVVYEILLESERDSCGGSSDVVALPTNQLGVAKHSRAYISLPTGGKGDTAWRGRSSSSCERSLLIRPPLIRPPSQPRLNPRPLLVLGRHVFAPFLLISFCFISPL